MAFIQLLTMLSAKSYKLTKRIGQGKAVIAMAGGICICSLLLIFTDNPAASIMLIALVGLSEAMIVPISSDIQNKSISTSDRATILSAYAMTIDIVSAFINLAIGKTADQSIQLSFAVCGALAAAALLLSLYYFRRINTAEKNI
jgi:MFS family permease